MQKNSFQSYRLVVGLTAALIIGLIGYGIYIAIDRSGKELVNVYLIPRDTQLTANGKTLGEGTAYLAPGTYTIEAKRPGFGDQKETVTIGSPNETDIDIALRGVSKSAIEWEKANQKLYLKREGRGGDRARKYGEKMREKNPIMNVLPFSNLLYSIGFKTDPADPSGQSIIILITATPGYREAALQKMRDLGFEPTDFTINFNDYKNPFDE